jgi:hypothetical protein
LWEDKNVVSSQACLKNAEKNKKTFYIFYGTFWNGRAILIPEKGGGVHDK